MQKIIIMRADVDMDEKKEKLVRLAMEFIRYVLVGGLAFVVDWGTLVLTREFVFTGGSEGELAVCTAAGFITGLIANYLLSILFVFRQADNKNSGKSASAFLVFTIVGLIGLGLTEIGMYVGVYLFKWNYMITKVLVAGAVLVWNYAGRKIFVFSKKSESDK